MDRRWIAFALVAALPLAGCAQTAGGDGAPLITSTATPDRPTSGDGARQRTAAAPKLPKCERPLGKLAIVDKDIPALTQLGLGSATPVLKVMIGQSGCFQIVDHQVLAHGASGRKLARADFILDPDVLTQAQKGGHLAGGLGSLLPGNVGVIAGSITTSTTEAQTSLFVTDARTGVQIAAATGASKTEDLGLALPGYEPIGGYSGDSGKTVIAAFQNAYINLVGQMQARPATVASRR